MSCENAFVTNILFADVSLSHRKHLLLTLRFRTENILLLTLRFRTENILLLTLRFRTENILLLTLRFRTENILSLESAESGWKLTICYGEEPT